MFVPGRMYWARSEDGYAIKVECVGRTEKMGTFQCPERDAQHMGLRKGRFTRRIEPMDVPDMAGAGREAVVRLSRHGLQSRWWVTDEEAKASRRR